MIQSYRDLKVYHAAYDLSMQLFWTTKHFPKEELYSLADQMRRSSVSVPSNIAEGQGRQHTGEFKQFLHIALGSAAEVDTQTVIAFELEYITKEESERIEAMILEIRKMIYGLIAHFPQ